MKNLKLKSARVAKDLTQQGLADSIGKGRLQSDHRFVHCHL